MSYRILQHTYTDYKTRAKLDKLIQAPSKPPESRRESFKAVQKPV